MTTSPINDIDLHAYVDGQLSATRRAEVEAYLAGHAEARDQVEQLREEVQRLHRQYDGILNEPVPARLTAAAKAPPLLKGFAAGLAWLACGLVIGWLAHVPQSGAPAAEAAFAKNALAAHVLYATEQRHPVEVPAAQEAHLTAWLSKRLAVPIRAPDLHAQGFSLLGGRLLPGNEGPLAQLMYESTQGERLTLTVKHASQPQTETGFKVMESEGASVFYWIDRQYGYALSGSVPKSRLLDVAHSVDAQLQH